MCFIVSSTGHGWREVQDEWDLPRVEQWLAFCETHPPLQLMVQSYLGIKPQGDGGAFRVTEENFDDFMKMVNTQGTLNG